MAEAIIPVMAEGIINLVVDNLVKVAATKIASLLGLKKELDNLFNKFNDIKKVLQDAETRQIGEESVRGWLQKLKGVAYDVEDLLEEWRICFGDHQVRNSSCSTLTSLIKHPCRHLKYRKRVDEIKSRLEQIAREKEEYRLSEQKNYGFSDDTRVRRMREERRTDSWVDPSSVIGRDEDKKTLVTKLISEDGSMTCGSGSDKVPSIFIWGMGGLGKTTLAKSIYNDQRVKEHFGGKCLWVCVGEVFNREVIMQSMIKSWGENIVHKESSESVKIKSWGENIVHKESSESVKPSSPREQLAEMLKDRKYLLILDDVWNEDYLEWEPLQEILNQGAKGSKIVITARNAGVASKIGSAYTHELKGLGYDDCLSIFKKIVVEPGKEEEYEPLMDIGGEIVRKCGGLPLAVKTVASAVKGRQPTKEQWDSIVNNNIIWDLSQSKAGILPALMLSYTELPPQLKNCFGYCSIFEKDTLMEKDELVSLWVSQGYIVEEEIGEKCFKELLARSMFQEPEIDDDGTIRRCKMHDLVHDLAQWVIKEECRIIGNDDANNNNNALSQLAGARHYAVRRKLSTEDINLAGVENLRTLIYSPDGELTLEPIDLVKLLKSVRVLKLRNCRVCPHSWKHLGKLVHLRHLDLRHLDLTQLRAVSIAKLKELTYLCLSDNNIKTLPENIGTLSSLRQLNIIECNSLVNLPKTIVSLPHLQVINLNDCSDLKELPELKDLPSLRELNINECTSLVNLPKTIVSLPHLQVINLNDCSDLKELPELKDLPSLRQLNVKWCGSLVNLPKTIVSLPHLQVINLSCCSNLKELPEGILEMTSLRRLNVEGCWELKKLPNGIGRRKDVVVTLDNFCVEAVVGDEGGGCSRSNIGELGVVNVHISEGYLNIRNLEKVGSRDEARTAKLEEKTSLSFLYLYWKDGDTVTRVAADDVLEGLRPPPSLVSLEIHEYPGQTFPSWMGDGGAAFRRLEEVQLWKCKSCNQLPPLGQLPCLEKLSIYGLDGVERVGREFFGGPSPTFPCLKDLTFECMRNWSEWVALSPISSEGEEGSAESPIMPALESLEFIDCPKLEAMPPIFTTSLRRLTIDDSSPVLYHRSSLQFLPLFETIAITGNRWNSKSTEDAHNPLICVVIGEKATELPAGLLLHHTALRMLILADLQLLRSLPEELTQLTALQQLIIWNCPELSGRCRVGGELWPEIAHIPHIRIDEEDIQSA